MVLLTICSSNSAKTPENYSSQSIVQTSGLLVVGTNVIIKGTYMRYLQRIFAHFPLVFLAHQCKAVCPL